MDKRTAGELGRAIGAGKVHPVELVEAQLGVIYQMEGDDAPTLRLLSAHADDVGLGKTIEACLILQRLLATGRARRVLILVPEAWAGDPEIPEPHKAMFPTVKVEFSQACSPAAQDLVTKVWTQLLQ